MNKLKYIPYLLFLFALSASAQVKNTIGLSYGINCGLVKDLNFSPLRYNERGSLYSIYYLRHKRESKNIFKVGIDFSSGKLKTDASSFLTSNFIYGKFNATYLRKIKTTKNKKWNFYTGMGYTSNIFYYDWDDNEAFSFLATHGLHLNFKTHFILNKLNSIYSTFSVPFLQILGRPPYNGRNEFIIENQNSPAKILFNGGLATFNKYYGFSLDTRYNLGINKNVDLSLNYNLNVQKITGVNKATHLQNQLQVGLNFKF